MNSVLQILKTLGISYDLFEHPAVFTCEEAERLCPKFNSPDNKNLFLRDKKGKNHYLVVLKSSKRLDLKGFAKRIGESKLSMASPERLHKYLGLTPGAVSPFGLINDAEKEVEVFVDKELMDQEKFHAHPNVNTATVELKVEDFVKFLDYCGNKWKVMEFD